MSTPKLDVRYVADLARIALTDAEVEEFQPQLDRVLEHVRQLEALDVSNVEPTAHTRPVFNVFRADESAPGLRKERVIENAPHAANGLVMITKVIE